MDNLDISAVVLCPYDWKGAFYRLDPTNFTIKCIKMGIRSSVIKVLVDFVKDRKMQFKFNKHTSSSHNLTGGSPQESILDQFLWIIGNDNAGDEVPEEKNINYIDDLATLEETRPGWPRWLQTLRWLAQPICKKKKLWHVTHDTWQMTCDT